jgi:Ni/Co efflux regulator RcnB
MKRTLMMLMMFAVLATPMLATADDQTIPPEANWTPTPPARQTVDAASLVSLLAQKGMITPQEYAQLTSPQSSSTSESRHARVWTWDEIYRNPVLTTP